MYNKFNNMMRPKKSLLLFAFVTFAMWYSIYFHRSNVLLNKTIGIEIVKTYPYSTMKYILQWTKSYTEPFIFMGRGQTTFIRRGCPVNNCFITADRKLLRSVRDFDAVLFHGPELSHSLIRLPKQRSKHQKYVFVSSESSSSYPILYNVYDGYFNWTWTYRLNSDIYYGYIMIKNNQGDIIGPREVMHWLKPEDMMPISYKLKKKLNRKRIAAAWFVSHCHVKSKRIQVAKSLQKEIAKYNLTIDIYGICGTKYCPRIRMKDCLQMLERDYYFYLAFENTIVEDYVTEKLLHAVQHYTIPIVYGGANYTRYMPEGSYLNIGSSDIEGVGKQMFDIINNKQKYYDFFKWTNHYSYHYGEEFPETDYYCNFCSRINNAKLVKQISIKKDFRTWWHNNLNFN